MYKSRKEMKVPRVTSMTIEMKYRPHWSPVANLPRMIEKKMFTKWISPFDRSCLRPSRKNSGRLLLGRSK
jgi:hypothetical protein